MKKVFILLLFLIISVVVNAQSDWAEIKYFIEYNYSSIGSFFYRAENPYDNVYLFNEYGVNCYETYTDPDNNFGFGLRTAKNQFFVTLLNISSDSYSFGFDDLDIERKVSLLTISPYIGLKQFFLKKEKIGSYIQFGLFNRFSFAKSEDYVNENEKKDYEQALEDVTSPARILLEFGVEYFITNNISFGISLTNYLEFLSGKALAYDWNYDDYIIYDFSRNRFGQFYNLNLIIYF